MAVATSTPDGSPSLRYVLLRGFDRRGFVFYTNRRSRKGGELAANPAAAVAFRWDVVDRQVRAAGPVELVDDSESDAYFAGRSRGSQLGAWASEQSRPIGSREELARRVAQVEARYPSGPVPRPPWWGGYRLVPREFEFWQQGSDRLHDRFAFVVGADGTWSRTRLSP
jgi:pyridoxamine 5'-phosphate oxidase